MGQTNKCSKCSKFSLLHCLQTRQNKCWYNISGKTPFASFLTSYLFKYINALFTPSVSPNLHICQLKSYVAILLMETGYQFSHSIPVTHRHTIWMEQNGLLDLNLLSSTVLFFWSTLLIIYLYVILVYDAYFWKIDFLLCVVWIMWYEYIGLIEHIKMHTC